MRGARDLEISSEGCTSNRRPAKRDFSLDYLRSALTVAVVAHHSALAYNTFSRYDPVQYIRSTAPIVDWVRFAPLDYLVAWDDIFFMALMFFISGLFVAPGLVRKGPSRFLADRAKRLGIPFIASVVMLTPLAYYPSWRMGKGSVNGAFLEQFFHSLHWPIGPAWFLWVLLLFNVFVSVVARYVPLAWRNFGRAAKSPSQLAITFGSVSFLSLAPLYLFFSPRAWASLGGPFAFQTTRLLLYFGWFLLGLRLGGENLECSLSTNNLRPWRTWLSMAALFFVAHWTISGSKFQSWNSSPVAKLSGAALVALCASFTSLGLIGLFRSAVHSRLTWAEHLSRNAYGIYVVHYVFVIWLQFSLLPATIPAPIKFLLVFSLSLAASWLLTQFLRQTIARTVL
jgi:hypothetical protein